MTSELWDFWLRSGGSSRRLHRLLPRADLPLGAQLLCALIARDKDKAEEIFATDSKEWMLYFLGFIQENALASLALHSINLMGLRDVVAMSPPINKESSESVVEGVWLHQNVAVNLQRMSGIELSYSDAFDDQFLKLLDCLAPLCDKLVWPKGIALARSVYEEPFHRQSGDYDCIVRQEDAAEFVRLCGLAGFTPLHGDPGFCNQLEVGPSDSWVSLFAAPTPLMKPSGVIGLAKQNSRAKGRETIIDPKFNYLDRGLTVPDAERFVRESIAISWRDRTFRAPSLIDHLVILAVHSEKDRFRGWKSLIDIHLLSQEITKAGAWSEFVQRCRSAGTRLSAWSTLALCVDRFDSPVPQEVLLELRPHSSELSTYFTFAVEPLFYWNCSSLPGLLLNAWFTADRHNKLTALRRAALPDAEFLAVYYSPRCKDNPIIRLCALLLHWLVLLLPGLFVRRTFGRWLWPQSEQYVKIAARESAIQTS